jgi:hypothetical protein
MIAFALWSIGALIAAGYCIVRGIGDLRRRNYAAGVIGVGSAAIFLLTPIQTERTHPASIGLPTATRK